ncbi:MAG: hypothetical protein DCC67_05915 [Planctomycetota bacterium]|nr:MAG: hypothetical protein DCC67_05915 [Planctomycetota bacterium]
MTRLASLALVLAVALGCGQSATVATSEEQPSTAPAAATPVAFNAEGAPTVTFSVPDMMCEFSCVPTVRDTLAKQPGVKDVQVVLESKTATVAVDQEKFDPAAAIAALVDLQFTNTKLAGEAKPEAAPAEPSQAPHAAAPDSPAPASAKS